MKKRIIYSTAFCLGVFFLPTIAKSQTFNANNASSYADTWTCDNSNAGCDPTMHNPAYNYYSGNDCANFVSQCLIAGGISLSAGSNGSGNGVNIYGCIPYCDNLHLNLKNYQNTTYSGHLTSGYPASFTKGDLVIFGDNSSDYWKHAAINVVTGTPSLDAHTSNRYHRPLSFFYPGAFASADFYHFNTVSSTVLCNNDYVCGSPVAFALPVNSSCVNYSCSTVGATSDGSIAYSGAGSCTSTYQSGRYDDDVWFTVTPNCNTPMTIKVTPTSNLSNFDVCIGLYSGSCNSPTQVGCADNNSVGVTENLNFTPVAGTTYRVRVFSYGIGSQFSGNFNICVTQSCSNCIDPFESNDGCSSSTLVFANPLGTGTSNYTINGNIGFAGDQDWYKLQLQSCGNLTVSLSNLPYNYDLEMYSGCPFSASNFVGSGYNAGTTSEQIVYSNTNPSLTTLYVKVYPLSSSNYTTVSCYNLNFSWASTIISQPGSISGNQTVCSSSSNTYNIAPVSGATNYSWSYTGSGSPTGNGTSITFSPVSSGTLSVIANGNCGTSSPSTLAITVATLPAEVTVNGSGTFCNNAILTANGGNGGTIYWQGTTSNGTSFANPSTSQTVTTSGTYYFRAYNSCGWGQQGSTTVVINNLTNNWTGAVSNAWEDPTNWSCGAIPDANTNVIITSGTVIVNSIANCRSLTVMPGVSFTINSGYMVIINH